MDRITRWSQCLSRVIAAAVLMLMMCCQSFQEKPLYIVGVDPSWYPLRLDGKDAYVNGFLDELLNLIGKQAGCSFQSVRMNWDNVVDGLVMRKYPVMLSTLPSTRPNLQKFNMSQVALYAGSCLVVLKNDPRTQLADFQEGLIGCVQYSEQDLYLKTHSNLFPRYFPNTTSALVALIDQEIDGVLADVIFAMTYVEDIGKDSLKIGEKLFPEQGVRLVALKGEHDAIIERFNQGLKQVKLSGDYQRLLKKWQLPAYLSE